MRQAHIARVLASYHRSMEPATGMAAPVASKPQTLRPRHRTGIISYAIAGAVVAGLTAYACFLLHFNLAAAVPIELLLVVVVALRWGFFQATVVSLVGVAGLNFLFVPPLFKFVVADPHNWIALATFELTALLVSGLSTRAQSTALEAELQRARSLKLYELSRAILLIDGRRSVTAQLQQLVEEVLHAGRVQLWTIYEHAEVADIDVAINATAPRGRTALDVYREGTDDQDANTRTARRLLRIGTTAIGAVLIEDWEIDDLLADGAASLSALAVERARAVQQESRAESERDAESLRTAVLDGLAHGFKTPLTAILTASSGLLAIGHLDPTQTELVTIIDEQAGALNKMTTTLLRTAALERREVKLRKSRVDVRDLVRQVVADQEAGLAARVQMSAPHDVKLTMLDPQMFGLALVQLIDNAAKYGDPETSIGIAITQTEFETAVMVENTGPAIPQRESERLFERFFRGPNTSQKPPGTGLGLSVVKKTALAHNGRAWVESADRVVRFYIAVLQQNER